MIEVEVENFQSIRHISFQIDRFTALVGRSDIGKSAIARAIRCALTGAAGTGFVRHGPSCERRTKGNKKCKCQSTVTLKMGCFELKWEKGDSVNQYTLTRPGEEPVLYTAVDRGTPDFLKPEFEPVKVGGSNKLIQVSEQFSPIFLLDQSGPAVADVLSDVARLDSINDAMALVLKDRKAATSRRKVREQDVTDLQQVLEGYQGLDEATAKVDAAEQTHKAIQAAQDALQSLDEYLEGLGALVPEIKALGAATAPETPDLDPVLDEARSYDQVTRFLDEISERAPVVRKLRGIEKVKLPDLDALVAKGDELDQVAEWLDQVLTLRDSFMALKGVVDVPDLGELPGTGSLDQLGGFAERLARVSSEIDTLTNRLGMAESEEQAVLDEYRDLGVCPTCSQQIDAPEHHHDGQLDGFPANGLLCEVCGEPQYETPHGEVCKNGHGGAMGVKP